MLDNEIPSGADFDAGRVTRSDVAEAFRQRLYDFQLYPFGGVSQMSFFAQAKGSGVTTALGSVVGSVKTDWDTNLEIGNTLPSGKQFLIESIEMLFLPGSVATASTYTPASISLFAGVASAALAAQANDLNTFLQSGLLELNILSKNYLRETPLIAFPPKAHIDLSAAVASNSATAGLAALVLAKGTGRPYYLTPRLTLQPAVNFEVLAKWPSPVPTSSGFNARVGIYLDGFFGRASQ